MTLRDVRTVQGCDTRMLIIDLKVGNINIMKHILTILLLAVALNASAQRWSEKMAATAMANFWKDSLMKSQRPPSWTYEQGVVFRGIEGVYKKTGDKKYFNYIQRVLDSYLDTNGVIRNYKMEDYNIDNIPSGRGLLLLYKETNDEKYLKAATTLRNQLINHPRTNAGGFWHKKRYPYQMWLDGLYMGEPFYAEWAKTFKEDTIFNDVARQFILMEQGSRDPNTGLLYHAFDESKEQQWADKTTGRSPHVWGRAMGWYGMALVDALELFPADHPQRKELVQILNRFATAVINYQDKKTGLWYDIVDLGGKEKNYLEASASSMFVYALTKGVRLGYLPKSYLLAAKKGYAGIIKEFIREENGQTNLHGTVSVSGLGGDPYRDGSYEYYMKEKVVVNDPKGVGAFILASNEIELL